MYKVRDAHFGKVPTPAAGRAQATEKHAPPDDAPAAEAPSRPGLVRERDTLESQGLRSRYAAHAAGTAKEETTDEARPSSSAPAFRRGPLTIATAAGRPPPAVLSEEKLLEKLDHSIAADPEGAADEMEADPIGFLHSHGLKTFAGVLVEREDAGAVRVNEVFDALAQQVRAGKRPLSDARSRMLEQVRSPSLIEERAKLEISLRFERMFVAHAQDKAAFDTLLKTAFGDAYAHNDAEALRQRALQGDFGWLPPIHFVDSEGMRGGHGAYENASGTVFLNRNLLNNPTLAAEVYAEEVGHHLDSKLNATDSVGDEGELFRRLMAGEQLSAHQIGEIRRENDKGFIIVDGRRVEVEFFFPLLLAGLAAMVKVIVEVAAIITLANTVVKEATKALDSLLPPGARNADEAAKAGREEAGRKGKEALAAAVRAADNAVTAAQRAKEAEQGGDPAAAKEAATKANDAAQRAATLAKDARDFAATAGDAGIDREATAAQTRAESAAQAAATAAQTAADAAAKAAEAKQKAEAAKKDAETAATKAEQWANLARDAAKRALSAEASGDYTEAMDAAGKVQSYSAEARRLADEAEDHAKAANGEAKQAGVQARTARQEAEQWAQTASDHVFIQAEAAKAREAEQERIEAEALAKEAADASARALKAQQDAEATKIRVGKLKKKEEPTFQAPVAADLSHSDAQLENHLQQLATKQEDERNLAARGGETLRQISQAYGIDMGRLIKANPQLNGGKPTPDSMLGPGDLIHLPTLGLVSLHTKTVPPGAHRLTMEQFEEILRKQADEGLGTPTSIPRDAELSSSRSRKAWQKALQGVVVQDDKTGQCYRVDPVMLAKINPSFGYPGDGPDVMIMGPGLNILTLGTAQGFLDAVAQEHDPLWFRARYLKDGNPRVVEALRDDTVDNPRSTPGMLLAAWQVLARSLDAGAARRDFEALRKDNPRIDPMDYYLDSPSQGPSVA